MAKNTNPAPEGAPDTPAADEAVQAPPIEARLNVLESAIAGLADAVGALVKAQAANASAPAFVGPGTQHTSTVNARVREILSVTPEALPVHLEPGQAVIVGRTGKGKKLIDAGHIMPHGQRVKFSDRDGDGPTGSHFYDVKEGHLIVQRFRPYNSEDVTEGNNSYFDFRSLGYAKGPDNTWYHPQYGLAALNKARQDKGLAPINFEE